MLSAASDRRFGTSRMRTALVMERRFRAHFVRRDQLVFDSRFAAPAAKFPIATLYVVCSGGLEIAQDGVVRGRGAYLLNVDEFECPRPGAPTFRSWGAPSVVVEMRLRAEDVIAPVGLLRGPIPLSDATWARFAAAVETLEQDTPIEPHVAPLMEALVADRVVSPGIGTCVEREPEAMVRVW
jgi:hypothetical protein